jgi:4-aminobutyrate aminotransferase/4-aminobutyrate aminotransferase/(S)-3-amino-2-methylpropionate transaminase
MVAGLATIAVLEEENLIPRAVALNEYFKGRLLEMQQRYEMIGDIRGPGLMLGVELVKNRQTKEPARKESYEFEKEGLKRGVLFGTAKYAGMGNVVKVKPPLVITDAQAEKAMEVFEDTLRYVSTKRDE